VINPTEFKLIVKHLPDVEIIQDEDGDLVSMPPIEVIEGPDGEIGIPGNIALLCNFVDGELIIAGFDNNKQLYLSKITSD